MSLSVYLVKGFRRAKQEADVSGFFSKSSTIGIALGVAILILSLSVINGFEFALKNRLLNVIPHIEFFTPDRPMTDFNRHAQLLKSHNNVLGVAPYIKVNAMVSYHTDMQGVVLKGVDSALEKDVSDSNQYITPGSATHLKYGEVILGRALIKKMGLKIGDSINLLLLKTGTSSLANVKRVNLQLVGEVDLGGQLDANFGLISLSQAQQLKGFNADQFDGIQVKIDDVFNVQMHAMSIGRKIDALVYIKTWYRTQGNLYQDIQMVRMIVYITVFLIVAVASFNIVSTLIMEVQEKRASIAILKTMGAKDSAIIKSFLLQGIYQAATGLIWGVLIGVILSLTVSDIFIFISELFGKNVLSGVYFIEYLPSKLNWFDLAVISLITLMMTLIACIYPALKASKMDPAKILSH
jgi:lipoprotein-releasing system permease protein